MKTRITTYFLSTNHDNLIYKRKGNNRGFMVFNLSEMTGWTDTSAYKNYPGIPDSFISIDAAELVLAFGTGGHVIKP